MTETDIRNSITQALSGNTDAADRVFPDRWSFANCTQMPCVWISTHSESRNESESGGDTECRRVQIRLRLKNRSSTTSEIELDQLKRQVSQILNADYKPLDGVPIEYDGADTEFESVGTIPFELRVMTFNAEYQFKPDEQAANDFLQAGIQWNTDSESSPEAEDLVNLPT